MNAVERLQAAIAKLETLKSGGAANWYVKPNDLIGGTCIMPVDSTPGDAPVGVHEIADFMHADNAELIVALHRAVGPQLTILRLALATAARQQSRGETPRGPALDVADAILGES